MLCGFHNVLETSKSLGEQRHHSIELRCGSKRADQDALSGCPAPVSPGHASHFGQLRELRELRKPDHAILLGRPGPPAERRCLGSHMLISLSTVQHSGPGQPSPKQPELFNMLADLAFAASLSATAAVSAPRVMTARAAKRCADSE